MSSVHSWRNVNPKRSCDSCGSIKAYDRQHGCIFTEHGIERNSFSLRYLSRSHWYLKTHLTSYPMYFQDTVSCMSIHARIHFSCALKIYNKTRFQNQLICKRQLLLTISAIFTSLLITFINIPFTSLSLHKKTKNKKMKKKETNYSIKVRFCVGRK